ncbi:hypothetical protein E4U40_000238, partial [Claviceps sp. LM458 group G5]
MATPRANAPSLQAGHEGCSAAPKRVNGEVKRLSHNKLKKVRRNGRQAYANANAVAAPRESAAPADREFTFTPSSQTRKRDRDGSAPTHVPPSAEVEMTDAPSQGSSSLSQSRFAVLSED